MTSLSRSWTLPPDIYGGTWNTCQQSNGGDGKGVPRGVRRGSEKRFLNFVEQSYWLAGLPSTIYLRVNESQTHTHACYATVLAAALQLIGTLLVCLFGF